MLSTTPTSQLKTISDNPDLKETTGATSSGSITTSTPLSTAPKPSTTLQSATPTFQDYVNEAKRLGQEQYAAQAKELTSTSKELGQQIGRQLYGRNFSLEGNAAQSYIGKSLQPVLEAQSARGEAYAAQLGQKALDQWYTDNTNRLKTQMELIQSGNYTPSEADKTALASAGWGGTINTNRDVTYGKNSVTGQSYASDTEAKAAADQKAYQQNLLNQYGMNPITGQAFTNASDAALFKKYGVNPNTGQLYTSEEEAQRITDQLGFNQQITQKYGVNPLTGKSFTSENEALDSWQSRGFQKDLIQQYGINPGTGQPFTSSQEAVSYFTKKNNLDALDVALKSKLQDIMSKYGTKPDGTPFQSEQEAQMYWDKKTLQAKFGTKDDGSQFNSEQEAVDYYKNKAVDTNLLKKYGVSPSGIPWSSEQAALAYYQQKGFDTNILQAYGTKEDGTPFKSEQEAKDYQDIVQLNKLKVNIKDEAVRDSIDSVAEYNHYLETGKTYENDIADIMQEQKTLDQWRTKLPTLNSALAEWQEKIRKESAKPTSWYAGNRRNQGKIDYYTAQYNAILQAINDINGGKVPILPGFDPNSTKP